MFVDSRGKSDFLTRSQGPFCKGSIDQYADGKAARMWESFIGSIDSRTQNYYKFLVGLLKKKECKRILDVACGTGIDSVMLLEEGFEVTSIDASDKMLKYAFKKRWNRRKEKAFDSWVIEEANWLTLSDDIKEYLGEGFDAVICLGNSFAHLIDMSEKQFQQKKALQNFEHCIRRGGLLFIDHRNFDYILDKGSVPTHCIYYNSPFKTDIQTSVLYVANKPAMVMMDYVIDTKHDYKQKSEANEIFCFEGFPNLNLNKAANEFRLCYYPHRLEEFTKMLNSVFPYNTKHTIYGDFKALNEIENPGFYIHVLEKPK